MTQRQWHKPATLVWLFVACAGSAGAFATAPAARGQTGSPQAPAADAKPESTPPATPTAAPEPRSEPMSAPDASPAVAAALDAPFLKPDEAKDLRVFFGLATAADLDTLARRARAALIAGRFLDPTLSAPDAALLDRAESLIWQGSHDAAIKLLEQEPSLRAVRLRTWAYEQAGRSDMAIASSLAAREYLAEGKFTSAADVADAVRAVAISARLRAPIGQPGSEHQALMAALKTAREDLDRLAWPVYLAEAELLYDKDNSAQAQQALEQVLSMNPHCAEAWAMLGRMAVDAFDMPSAEAIAVRIDTLAGALPEEAEKPQEPADADAPAPPPAAPVQVAAAEPAALAPASPLAAAIRIRAMLRQNDPDQAEALSAGALAAYPNQPTLRELRCAVIALRFDDNLLNAALEASDQASNRAPRAHYEAGYAMAQARQYARAAELLRLASARAPYWPKPAIDLGLLFIQSGQDAEALDTLTEACDLDPFNVRAENSLKLVREMQSYERLESEHFIVRFKPTVEGTKSRPSPDAALAREMLPVLEENHRLVTGAPEQVPGGLDYSPPGKTFIDLMPNHRWFAVRIAGMPRIHTIAASTGPIIAMEAPRDGQAHSGGYDWPRVLRHEYTHTVGLGKTANRLPHWFTEAQSVYLEHSPRDYPTIQLLTRTFQADELFDFVEINAAFVRPKKPTDRQLAYAQGHWMYEYIVRTFGERAPLKLMDLYAQGVREEEAYQRVLRVSRDQFMVAFKIWAREQLVEWGMVLPAGQPELVDLLKGEALRLNAASDKPAPEDEVEPAEPTAELVARLLDAHPTHPDVLELACRQRLEAAGGSPTLELAPLLQRYAKARPADPLPHRMLARLYLAQPDPPATEAGPTPRDAIEHLEWLDAREDKSPAYASQLSALYLSAGDMPKAIAKAARAVQFAPYDPRYREKAAAVMIQQGDLTGAKSHIEAMILLEPDRAVHRQRLDALRKRMGQ